MQPDNRGIGRWVLTRPYKIFSKQLSNEIVTYSDFRVLAIDGKIASRDQVVDDAVQLINNFPAPPIGDMNDLKSLKEDVEVLRNQTGIPSLGGRDQVKSGNEVSSLPQPDKVRGIRISTSKMSMLLDGECIDIGVVPGMPLRVLVGWKIWKDEPRECRTKKQME